MSVSRAGESAKQPVAAHPDRDITGAARFLLGCTTPRSVAAEIVALDMDADALGEHPDRGSGRDEIPPGQGAVLTSGKGMIVFEIGKSGDRARFPIVQGVGACDYCSIG